MARKENIVAQVERLAAPIAENLGLEIWDVEFVKEGSNYFLRIFIDKIGGVSLEDCEAFSRAVDPEIDRADPIEQGYCLEISSPGIERELKKDWHFEKFIGSVVKSRLIRPDALGRRDLEGRLVSFDGQNVVLETDGGAEQFKLSDAAYVRLADDGGYDDFDIIGVEE